MEYQDIIDAASERVKDIASDIPSRPVEELVEYYFTTFVDKDGKNTLNKNRRVRLPTILRHRETI